MDFEHTDDRDLYRTHPRWLLPVMGGAAALAACALAALGGFAVGTWQAPDVEAAEQVVTANDIAFARVCAPIKMDAQTEIEGLSSRIHTLNEDIQSRKARVAELEAEMSKRADAGKRLWRELEDTREALAVAVQQKELLESEKANLVAQLTQTRTVLAQTEEALDDQIDLTEEVHEDWIDQHFERFVNAAQLEICERGNRKKLGACRETVTGLLRRDKVVVAFEHCLRSGQEAPMVVNHDIDGPLPMFASYLDQRDKVVRDWAVQSCDPTLPEAPALLASSAQRLGIL